MITVEMVRSESALTELRDSWCDLLANVPNASIFLTWEWITTWWRHYGNDKELYILLARDEDNALVGIAPLMLLKSGWGPIAIRRLHFIGTGIAYPAHLDIIAQPDDTELVVRSFLAALQERKYEWDVLELVSLSETSCLKDYIASFGGQIAFGYSMTCPFITLPDDWNAYEMNELSTNMRQQLRRAQRKLEKEHSDQVVFSNPDQPDQVPAALNELVFLNRRRWHEADTRSSFDESRIADFSLDFALAALEQGWLRFSVLTVEDTTIAASYCFRYKNTYYNYQSGFSLEWGNYSPGRLMMAHVLRLAIEEGAHEFDMLHGTAGAKNRWTQTIRSDMRLRVGHNLKGRLLVIGTTLFDKAVQFSRKYIPDSLRQRIGSLLPGAQW